MKKRLIILLLIVSGLSLKAQTPVDIYYHVPFIPQPTNVSCWSSSIAMILWWRQNEDEQMCLADALTPEDVERNLPFFEHYFGQGLSSYDASPLEYYNFISVQPSSFPVETFVDFLGHGPLWAAYFGCADPTQDCGHAVVVVGIRGNGTPENTVVILHDPDAGTGVYPSLGIREREMPYNEFIQRLNDRALHRLSQPEASGSPVNFLAYPRNESDPQRSSTETQESRGGH
jgi:hypothetical protein